MLPAAHRLRRSSDFAGTVRSGRRAGRGTVVVHLVAPPVVGVTAWSVSNSLADHAVVMPENGTGAQAPTQVGFVVSKAVGAAVTRNKVKRRLRALVAQRLTRLPAGSSLVVRALAASADASYAELGADLDKALAAALRPKPSRSPGKTGPGSSQVRS